MAIFFAFNLLYSLCFPLYRFFYFLYKSQEKDEISFFRKKIKKGMVVVDVGANIGFYTKLFSKLVGTSGKVYAFEPDKKNFKHLKDACRNLKNVKLLNAAVGERNGTLRLYESNSLNVDHVTYKTNEKRSSYPIKVLSLDKFFSNKKIDFVKIDTQGFEYNVLLGMDNLLKNNRNIMIFCEFQKIYLKRAGVSPEYVLKFLRHHRFKIKFMRDKEVENMPEDKTLQSNLIAERP